MAASCPVCHHHESLRMVDRPLGAAHSFTFNGKDIHNYVCASCGIGFSWPHLSQQELFQFYNQQYRSHFQKNHSEIFANIDFNAINRQRQRFDRIHDCLKQFPEWITAMKSHELVVDIGCYSGEILRGLHKSYGVKTLGFEIDANIAQYAATINEVEVKPYQESFSDGITGQAFHVSMVHVLEHFQRPGAVLVEVHRTLKPGGWFYCEVPDYLSDISYEIPHVYHFNRWTLRDLAVKCGLSVKMIKVVDGNLIMIARKPERALAPHMREPSVDPRQVVKLRRQFARRARFRQVSAWLSQSLLGWGQLAKRLSNKFVREWKILTQRPSRDHGSHS